jgi:hypothetical protein
MPINFWFVVVALFNAIAKVKREAAAAAAGDDGDDDNPDTSNAEVAKRSNGGDEGK